MIRTPPGLPGPPTTAVAGHPEPQRQVEAATAAPGLARSVLAGLDEAGVRWCLLRGGLEALVAPGDLDLLVAPADLARAVAVITAHGLIRLTSHGRASHRFFLGLDAANGSWVELDLVTELAYGRHFELRTRATDQCLGRRVRQDDVWVLAPGDEFWALLLHCVLDKGRFADHHLRRLRQLADHATLDGPLARALPDRAARMLLAYWRVDCPAALPAVRRRLLSTWWRAHPASAARRLVGSTALRSIERPLQAWSRRGAGVALIGPDGSGKSTLAQAIESTFYFPVRRVYMGLWPSNEAPRSTAEQGIRILLRPFTVWRRYLAAVRHRALGRLVVFDRYVYDALLPPRGPLVWLKRPYFQLLSRLCPAPDVVLLLDVPGPVMHRRSGEYDPEHLEREREQYRRLRRRVPHLERVDADRAPELVLADALGRIWRHYVERTAR
ncbi:nucleotidyltransferase family protein [Micromonospora sp. CB01531]|uniref:nucleotidyltransferase family protein n=1 Tax=Micromonospora sp. CB01531 TaxID=1718947 RepID=UPI0009FAE576|nr:nucleotidyltransferase family protein [Micromonospora sp. CB01531]